MEASKIAAVIYAQIFGFPLTKPEANLWQIKTVKSKNINFKIKENKKLRANLKINSLNKINNIQVILNNLPKISSISAIFLTGSIAVENARNGADIDLLVIASKNRLWLTRLIIIFYLKYKKVYKKICPNIYLSESNLEIKEKNLYTAHEILQVKPIFDRGGYYLKFLKANEWTSKYLPVAYENKAVEDSGCDRNDTTVILPAGGILLVFEFIVFIVQYLYQLPKQTNEKIGWGFAFFHPNNLTNFVLEKYRQELHKLGIMEVDET